MALLTGGVVVRLAQVQLVQGQQYRRLALEGDRRSLVLPAVRGRMLDRTGQVLARDRCAFTVRVAPSTYRRRSVLYALRDLWLLLGPQASARAGYHGADGSRPSPRTLLRLVAAEPARHAAVLLDLPASLLLTPSQVLDRRSRRLAVGSAGRRPPEWEVSGARARLRECVAVLRPEAGFVGNRTLQRLGGGGEVLGRALEVTPARLAARVEDEVRDLVELGAAVGCDTLEDVLERLDRLMEAEVAWIDERIHAELRSAVFLDHLGTSRPGPETLGAEAWLELARGVALPFREAEPARRALAAASALLGGRLPPRREPDVEGPVATAERAGLVRLAPVPVRGAWFRRKQRSPDFDRRRYLSAYRERSLRRQLTGGWLGTLGRGAHPMVARRVVGPGRLEDLGFRLVPAFLRGPVLPEETPSTHLLVGLVNSRGLPVSGLELRLDDRLRGRAGRAVIGPDGYEAVTAPPKHGREVQLTLSLSLQQRLEELLDVRGAVVVLDLRPGGTGGVLGLVSRPVAAPEELREAWEEEREAYRAWVQARRELRAGIAGAEARRDRAWRRLRDSRALNRALRHYGPCPPGSVLKPVALAAALEVGTLLRDQVVVCDVGRRASRGCRNHGPLTVVEAVERSCNHFCYQVGRELGREALVQAFDRLALFASLPGLQPARPGLKNLLLSRREDPRNLAIGQGSLSLSPVRVAGLVASLATGRVVRPHLLRPGGFTPVGEVWASPAALDPVRTGMRRVVGPGGTARAAARLRRYRVAGKTGTAQLSDDLERSRFNSWFAGYGPWEDPGFAVVVLLEETERSGVAAALLAQDVVEAVGEELGRWWD